MKLESQPSLGKEESAPERESAAILGRLREMANEHQDLGHLYEEILNRIDDYVLTKMKVVRMSENQNARYHLAEKFEDRLQMLDSDRHAAHNRLIDSLRNFAQQAESAGFDSRWWGDLYSDRGPRSARQRVDDWAMDIWLEREEEEKGKKAA